MPLSFEAAWGVPHTCHMASHHFVFLHNYAQLLCGHTCTTSSHHLFFSLSLPFYLVAWLHIILCKHESPATTIFFPLSPFSPFLLFLNSWPYDFKTREEKIFFLPIERKNSIHSFWSCSVFHEAFPGTKLFFQMVCVCVCDTDQPGALSKCRFTQIAGCSPPLVSARELCSSPRLVWLSWLSYRGDMGTQRELGHLKLPTTGTLSPLAQRSPEPVITWLLCFPP